MNTISKNLITEMLSYSRSREYIGNLIYIKKAIEKLGTSSYRCRACDLIRWIDPVHHLKDTDLEKYVYYDDEFMTEDVIQNIYNEFVLLFKYLPELKEIFVLKERHIEYNPNLSKSDIQEIYQFVRDYNKANPREYNHLYKKPGEE